MLTTIHMHTGEESQTVSCDGDSPDCVGFLDPGERWVDDAPWNDAQALSAAESRGWWVWGHHYCPACKAMPLGGAA